MASEPLTAEELDRIEDAMATCGFGAVEGSIPDLIAAARRCGEAERRYRELDKALGADTMRDPAQRIRALPALGLPTVAAVLARHAAEAEEAAK